MPTYQYTCTACDEPLEAVQKFTDDPLTECGVCGGKLRKVYSAVGIVFKGSGFYRTDSRNGSVPAGANGKSADGSAGSSSAGEGSGSSGSSPEKAGSGEAKSGSGDAKPARKAETASTGSSSAAGSKVA